MNDPIQKKCKREREKERGILKRLCSRAWELPHFHDREEVHHH
jgi:hypothetical protein